ncbi:MAG TPA: fluoride efflux transporter CrcB [Acidimicrobiia bacterium]|jgi:CrcB protein
MLVFGIAIAGALGAPARFLVERTVSARSRRRFPLGTFVVNVSGSFVLGFVTGLVLYHAFGSTERAVVGTGFCGAYTTFSAFAYETVVLVEARAYRAAAANVVASALVPALAAGAGIALAAL